MVNKKKFSDRTLSYIKHFLRDKRTYKGNAELDFWKTELPKIPRPKERIFKRYCDYFEINKNSFLNKIVVDMGCGPVGSLHFFNAKIKIGIEPLVKRYEIFDIKTHDMVYIEGKAENVPLISNYADVIISVNALDHVENFDKALEEINRILKPGGQILLELNLLEKASVCEPIILNLHDSTSKLKKYFIIEYKKILKKGFVFEFDGIATICDYDLLVIKGRKEGKQ